MKVIKRDGSTVQYDRSKIVLAIQKANAEVEECEKIDNDKIESIVDSIEEIFEQSGISYGKTSILNSLNKVDEKTTKAIYSSWDEFTSKKEINAARKIYKAIKDLEKRIKQLQQKQHHMAPRFRCTRQ